MKITFEEFNEAINQILEHEEKVKEWYKYFSYEVVEDATKISSYLEKFLKDLLDDEYDWIGYWLWELNSGRKYYDGCVTEKDGSFIRLETINDLWDLLEKNHYENHLVKEEKCEHNICHTIIRNGKLYLECQHCALLIPSKEYCGLCE